MNQVTVPTRLPVGLNWEMSETFDLLFGRGKTEMEKAVKTLSEVYEEGLKKGDYYAAGVALIRLRYIRRYGLNLPADERDARDRDYSRWYIREWQKEPRWDWRY